MTRLTPDYYLSDDVVALSKDLIGKNLFTCIDGIKTGGVIIETEAYRGPDDKASHAYGMRRTARNEVMYHKGGVCYVYICYGIHHLFNVVTNVEGIPHAILIRAIEPKVGIETMLERRKKYSLTPSLTSGPGAMSQALGIDKRHNGKSLQGSEIWIEHNDVCIKNDTIEAGPRVGIDYAGKDANLPWRFKLKQEVRR